MALVKGCRRQRLLLCMQSSSDYPEPVVDDKLERQRAIGRHRAVSAQ
jgi:hypothetical protein